MAAAYDPSGASPRPTSGGGHVSQLEIAHRLGLHRTTVTKVLNKTPNHGVPDETVRLIMSAARDLGYDFGRLRNIHRRRAERHPVNMLASVAIILDGGDLYDHGTAQVANLSSTGLLLTKLKFPKDALPLKPFTLHLVFRNGPLRGVQAEGDLVRFDPHGSLHVGINIIDIADEDRDRIIAYLKDIKNAKIRAAGPLPEEVAGAAESEDEG